VAIAIIQESERIGSKAIVYGSCCRIGSAVNTSKVIAAQAATELNLIEKHDINKLTNPLSWKHAFQLTY
jgi:hypothetical protein